MTVYNAPVEDHLFLLDIVFGALRRDDVSPASDASDAGGAIDADLAAAVLNEAGRIATEVLHPLNASGDAEGCRLENGVVATPKGFKDAWRVFVAGGWPALTCAEDDGGQGMPQAIGAAAAEMTSAANMAFAMYPGLTRAAYSAVRNHASDALKATYLAKMASGEWTGAMNLTEPHCGTDLGLIRTRATPTETGSYRVTGQKSFISAGDHDLADNVVHLVLAKLPDAPEGVKGISLFLVPKFLVSEDGAPGARNGVSCGGLERKMGIHANATCVMNYDDAEGWLVGEPHKGLRAMFTMMNEARLGVAIQGLSQSEIAYQNALAYARERLQGRGLKGPAAPDKPADPLITHPDVRRMLLDIKAFNEGFRALVLLTALRIETARAASDPAERQAAEDFVGLLTPVLKGYGSDRGFENCVLAQQIFGGHGYIEENGMSQFVRDARIAMIYEGANGVQALDLIGRKMPANGGRAVTALFAELDGFGKAHKDDPAMAEFIAPLKTARDHLQQAMLWFVQNAVKDPDAGAAGACDVMRMMGHVCVGWMWARIAAAAQAELTAGAGDAAFLQAKLETARYFMARVLPETATNLARITSGAAPVMGLSAESF